MIGTPPELTVYEASDPVEFESPGYSRTGIELWESGGRRWHEYCPGQVSPVAVTLEDKAALRCNTGHWPSNWKGWRNLPRWQRAVVKPA